MPVNQRAMLTCSLYPLYTAASSPITSDATRLLALASAMLLLLLLAGVAAAAAAVLLLLSCCVLKYLQCTDAVRQLFHSACAEQVTQGVRLRFDLARG
jgi:hypothetical protein